MAVPTWQRRELAILEAVAAAEERGDTVGSAELPVLATLSPQEVERGLSALLEGHYISGVSVAAEEDCYLLDVRLRERGRRATGQWPAEGAERVLLDVLQHRIDVTADPEERTRLERLYDAVKSVGVATARELTIAVIKQAAGLP